MSHVVIGKTVGFKYRIFISLSDFLTYVLRINFRVPTAVFSIYVNHFQLSWCIFYYNISIFYRFIVYVLSTFIILFIITTKICSKNVSIIILICLKTRPNCPKVVSLNIKKFKSVPHMLECSGTVAGSPVRVIPYCTIVTGN